jgi:hypothetical protein
MNHAFEGRREVECSNHTGTVFACTCGEKRENLGELEEHIAEETTKEALTRGIAERRKELE